MVNKSFNKAGYFRGARGSHPFQRGNRRDRGFHAWEGSNPQHKRKQVRLESIYLYHDTIGACF